jgi:hypothetical protein
MLDLAPIELEKIAARIKSDINSYCVERYSAEHREHLGASIIGEECNRKIWYTFRHAKLNVFDGRMLRLFDRGNREEGYIDEMLFGIGFRVYTIDQETGKQYRITGANGHYGGSADGVGISPYPEFKEPILLEKKTHNNRSFMHLEKNRLVIGKPQHYAQMCAYGKEFGFRYGLYYAVNKDNDEIYIEIVPLDSNLAIDLKKKAEDIIYSEIPPPKISLQPEYFECKFCVFSGICHFNELPEKNCRSCRHSHATDKARWFCDKFNDVIPPDFIPKGCDQYYAIGG